MAHPSSFTIEITGRAGGSQPQFAVDPVLVSAHVIVALQSVVSRSVPSAEQAVLSVTMVHGGEARALGPEGRRAHAPSRAPRPLCPPRSLPAARYGPSGSPTQASTRPLGTGR